MEIIKLMHSYRITRISFDKDTWGSEYIVANQLSQPDFFYLVGIQTPIFCQWQL
jgi:hypothetical protein